MPKNNRLPVTKRETIFETSLRLKKEAKEVLLLAKKQEKEKLKK